jgi:hypothetical protein
LNAQKGNQADKSMVTGEHEDQNYLSPDPGLEFACVETHQQLLPISFSDILLMNSLNLAFP